MLLSCTEEEDVVSCIFNETTVLLLSSQQFVLGNRFMRTRSSSLDGKGHVLEIDKRENRMDNG